MEVGYILFVHLTDREAAWQALQRHARTLSVKLSDQIRPGMLMLFIDPGWTDLLNVIGEDFNASSLAAGFDRIKRYVERIETIVEQNPAFLSGDTSRLRLITANTLNPIINNLRGNKPGVEAQRLRRFLVSDKPTLRYDTTKVAEAIIRIRHVGTGIPILRFDWDALLNDETLTTCWDSLVADIPARCREYLKDAQVRSFMISGGYLANRSSLGGPPTSFDDFNTCYATRVFPSLYPTTEVCRELNRSRQGRLKAAILSLCNLLRDPGAARLVHRVDEGLISAIHAFSDDNELRDNSHVPKLASLLDELTRTLPHPVAQVATAVSHMGREQFEAMKRWRHAISECQKALAEDSPLAETLAHNLDHGLFHHDTTLEFYRQIQSDLGSDHERSVISGAGLVLSDGAIIDLPPFSNCRENVMWIDDDLKYGLHDSLGHLSEPRVISRGDHPRVSRFVFKDRSLPGQGNLRPYVLGDYIPVLVRGIILDSWIRVRRDISALKNHVETRNRRRYTPFCAALERALRRGGFDSHERDLLREKLAEAALTRLTTLIESWSKLQITTEAGLPIRSFAAMWVQSDPTELNAVMDGLSKPNTNWLGWGLLEYTGSPRVRQFSDLRKPVADMVWELIEDACVYIEWALEWPKFIQSVRAVPKGALELDVDYSP